MVHQKMHIEELAKKLASQITSGYKVVVQEKARNIFNFSTDNDGVQLYELCFDHGISEKKVLATHYNKNTIHIFIVAGTIASVLKLKETDGYASKICMFKLNVRTGALQVHGIDPELFHTNFSEKSFHFFSKAHTVLFGKSKKIQLLLTKSHVADSVPA